MILGTQTDLLIKGLHLLMRSPFMIDSQMRRLANTNQCLVPPSLSPVQNLPVLKRGDRSESVKKLQRLLNGAGAVPALPQTGFFGEMTWKAVVDFQTKNGLKPVDGVVGPKTWSVIESQGGTPVARPTGPFPSAVVYDSLAKLIPSKVINELPELIEKYEINNNLRLAHFLAQCAAETSGLTVTVEDLNYSAKGLLDTFNKKVERFSEKQAADYARKPEAIANHAYANRMGNGDENSGDGYKYRGRGFIQLTGKQMYVDFGLEVGVDLVSNPDLVSDKYPLLSAAWFWSTKGPNEVADKGATDADVKAVTMVVNGGTNGLEKRQNWFKKFHKIIA
jgi:putative chitinase